MMDTQYLVNIRVIQPQNVLEAIYVGGNVADLETLCHMMLYVFEAWVDSDEAYSKSVTVRPALKK